MGAERGNALTASPLRVFSLPRYGSLGASSRIRFLQYYPWLEAAGLQVKTAPLLEDSALARRYAKGAYSWGQFFQSYFARIKALLARRHFDALWIEKEALPWWPRWLESALLRGVPFVLDYDDAVFHNYDRHRLALVRLIYGRRLDGLMARASLVVAGNSYLAERARLAGARWVEVVPTVIDLDRYALPSSFQKASAADGVPRVVWIGSPTTAYYLQLLRKPLQALAQRVPFVLRLIGAGRPEIDGINIEVLPWTEGTEVQSIAACDVGVMPLSDSPWERGKCGYKLIQYMACGLPVVASEVGVNAEIVEDGVNGYMARNADDWVVALERLLLQPTLRHRLGAAGRERVEAQYCIQKTGPRMAELLTKAAQAV